MSTVRSEKEAVVAEVRGKIEAASAVIITEYRGLTVTALADLRTKLRVVGAEYRPHSPLPVDRDCYSLCKPKV